MAVTNLDSNDVTILLGDGRGGFRRARGSPVRAGRGPWPVVVGDFNADRNPDLAVGNADSNDLTVLLGDGRGSFREASGGRPSVGDGPDSLAVGDFNRDLRQDLAVVSQDAATVTILLGDGRGAFSQAPGSPVRTGAKKADGESGGDSVVVGDFNRDRRQDLAVVNKGSNGLTILLGDGTGGFRRAPGGPVRAGNGPASAAVGDFNGDGRQDLAVANDSSNDVTILLGNGGGGFRRAPGGPVRAGTDPVSVAVGDFNGDGRQDLAVANLDDVRILLGDGRGGFRQAPGGGEPAGDLPGWIAVGDFNRDRRDDLAVANAEGVTVLLNTGSLGLARGRAGRRKTRTRVRPAVLLAGRDPSAIPAVTSFAGALPRTGLALMALLAAAAGLLCTGFGVRLSMRR